MVSIVIVSHSDLLANGLKQLALQMVQDQVAIAAAGGIDDDENPIGTDPMKVHAAIEAVYSPDGVVVMMDLGSALMSAEMALEFLTPEQQENVKLCAAPLVEGTVAAAVQAMVGASLEQVISEAQGALAVKANQLGISSEAAEAVDEATAVDPDSAPAQSLTLTVQNKNGLHARPAAQFVQTANRFTANIQVKKGTAVANAKSINQVADLGVRQGESITVSATGADADDALAAFQTLADNHFGESLEEEKAAAEEDTPTPTATATADKLVGIPASPGVALGPAFQYRPQLPKVEMHQVDDIEAEWQRLQTAVQAAETAVAHLRQQAVQQVGEAEAAIFDAHLLFLQDPDLQQKTRNILEREQINAAAAWQQTINQTADNFRQMESEYMRARAADIEDIGGRVLRELLGVLPPALEMDEPSILVAIDLTPSDTARLDPQKVLGICTELGGATAHSAILARALGIPAVVGAGQKLATIANGQLIGLNGRSAEIWLAPTAAEQEQLTAERESWLAEQQAAKAASQETAVTQDGHRVEIGANIGGPHDTETALSFGAEGVGLFRTEFLFLDRQAAPSEAEQLEAYRQVAQSMNGRPLIIRTLDVGGDKPLSYIDLGEEENPFLGWRGIRFCLEMPELFKPQLRAILQASVDENGRSTNLKLMFPMIGTVDEVRRAKALLDEVRQELTAEKRPFDPNMEVGVMIEVPSAVAIADRLAREVDFFSIGTNDLTQYVMAADRGNTRVANLAQPFQPAVLHMIQQAVEAAHAAGIWIGMCGELAGNPLATALLVGLGLDELSMSAPSIPAVKTAVRTLTLPQAKEVAETALTLDSVTAVEDFLQQPRQD